MLNSRTSSAPVGRGRRARYLDWRGVRLVGLFGLFAVAVCNIGFGVSAIAGLVLCAYWLWLAARWSVRSQWRMLSRLVPQDRAAVPAVSRPVSRRVYLGALSDGVRLSLPQRAVLVLGPPRSGKTSAVMIPSLLAFDGPVVSTSTKPDVMAATCQARSRAGKVWQFDPTGTAAPVPGVARLRWSPVQCANDWDSAMVIARAMVTGTTVGRGTTDATHWARRAQALLAPLLHAAARTDRDMRAVLAWVLGHELEEPAMLLDRYGAPVAVMTLGGVAMTAARERSSIFSAAADAVDAYASDAALDAATLPNFDPSAFAVSHDAVYIHADAERQQLAAPLVCGLLTDIRRAVYRHHANGTLNRPVLFALDEVANIAPLDELPQLAAEGGGQGLLLLAALQDLSQARARWGTLADGFLTLFGEKLLLAGIADRETLETVSVVLGEYDRRVVSHTRSRGSGQGWFGSWQSGTTVSTQRTRVLSPGEVAGLPAGRALHLNGAAWELLNLTPAHACEPWKSLTSEAVR